MHGGALEHSEVMHVEPTVAGAAGDDDGAGMDPLLIDESQRQTLAIGNALLLQSADFAGDRHLGAKFLRLVVGARHQCDAGDPGRKAEITLDARRRTGLAAKRAAIDDESG